MNLFKSSKAPAAPDPVATANAQTQSNKDTALYNAGINRPDQYTPYGSQTYNYLGNNADGSPHYRSDINFTPLGQSIFDQQQQQDKQLNDISGQSMDRVKNSMSQDFDTSSLPGMQSHVEGGNIQKSLPGADNFSADRQRVEDAMYSRLNPQFDRSQQGLDAKLANQGIMQGSEAWKNAQDDLSRERNDARMQTILAGGNEQSRLFGLNREAGEFANNAQQQQFGQGLTNANLANNVHSQSLQEALMERELPLNEFNSLRSAGQVQTPQFSPMTPVNMPGTDVAGNIWKGFGAQQDAYNQKVGTQNNTTSGLFNLGGAALMAFSDLRLKRNIKKIGATNSGLGIYSFKYLDSPKTHIGVIAQEVEKVIPEAVVVHPSGYKMVDHTLVR